MKRYWNKFLNWLIPNRRQKILINMMRESEEIGLYDEPFNTKEKREMKENKRNSVSAIIELCQRDLAEYGLENE